MDLLMILIAMIGIAASIANKKKTEEAKKRRTSFPEKGVPGSGSGPARNPQNRSTPPKPSATLSKTPSAPGTSKWPWPAQTAPQQQKKSAAPSYGGTPRYTHVVTSTLEGGHTHTESSMTGEETCPPPKPVTQKQAVQKAPVSDPNAGALLNFQPNSVLQGILYAEILGKPKALQRH